MRRILLAAALAAVPAVTLAHHGWSSYDMERTISHKSALTDVRWANPHGSAKVRYQNATWDVILAPVARMEARGLTREMLGPRQQVPLVGYPRKDGTRVMRLERVIAGDNRVELR